jgi:hypothetical protein
VVRNHVPPGDLGRETRPMHMEGREGGREGGR